MPTRSVARRLVPFATGVVSLLACLPLAEAADPPSEADTLFKKGVEEMRAKRYDVGCPMLARSYELDPVPGALFTLAECEAGWGESATAFDHYQAFVNGLAALPPERRAKFDERRRIALEKLATLAPVTSELKIDVPQALGANFVITRDGAVLDRAAYGVGKRVAPGEHTVRAELDGKTLWEQKVTIPTGDRAGVSVPWLEVPAAAPPPATNVPAAPLVAAPAPAPAPTGTSSSSTRTWAYFAGGIGLGGLATGIATGIIALNEKSTIHDNCPDKLCNAAGHDAVDSARTAATISTISFSVGLAGAAGAVILWIVSNDAKKSDDVARAFPIVVATDHGAAFGVGGRFR